jgi:Phosphotransferase enzyme family
VSLHRIDPRFALPGAVRSALVLGELAPWAQGLRQVGVDVWPDTPPSRRPDLVVAPGQLARRAVLERPPMIILEGANQKQLAKAGYRSRRLVLRPSRDHPTLAIPLGDPQAIGYAVDQWSVLDRRWKRVRLATARVLLTRGLAPARVVTQVTVASQESLSTPLLVARAHELGVPQEVQWLLTFGHGDALSRNVFHLFPPAAPKPLWVLKFARVADYSEPFDRDEYGLAIAASAGPKIAAQSPRLLGRFESDGVHVSLETAAVGRRLRDILLAPGAKAAKLRIIDRVASWIVDFGSATRAPAETLGAERRRLLDDIVPRWVDRGADIGLVSNLPPLPAVAQHNDLGSWNIVVDGAEFTVLDWESARSGGMPLWDLLYFLADALVLADGASRIEDVPWQTARLFRGEAPSSPFLFGWIRRAVVAVGVPAEAVGAIATLCWLHHSLSPTIRDNVLGRLAPGTTRPLHAFEGIAAAWLADTELGPRWRRWQQSDLGG